MFQETAGLPSWKARVTLLEIVQSMLFLNQFQLRSYREPLQELIVHLLSDEQLEVKGL